jgi:hypothetical protein
VPVAQRQAGDRKVAGFFAAKPWTQNRPLRMQLVWLT